MHAHVLTTKYKHSIIVKWYKLQTQSLKESEFLGGGYPRICAQRTLHGSERKRQTKREDKKDERRSKRSEFVCEEVLKVKQEEKLYKVRKKIKSDKKIKELQNAKFSDCGGSYLTIKS